MRHDRGPVVMQGPESVDLLCHMKDRCSQGGRAWQERTIHDALIRTWVLGIKQTMHKARATYSISTKKRTTRLAEP